MRCPNCHADQDQHNFYCASCGYDLHHSSGNQPEALPDINFDAVVSQTLDDIKRQAHTVELETLEKIQDRATKWAKTNLFILGLASSVLVLGLTFFGYKKVTDLENLVASETRKVEELVEEKAVTVERLVAETTQATEQATAEAMSSLDKALKVKQEIEQIDIGALREQFRNLQRLEIQLDKSISKSASIRSQLTAERENVQKLQHSFFSISIHIDGRDGPQNASLGVLLQMLGDEGFQLNQANVVEIGVNRTEVLYYNTIAREQAEMIAAIAQSGLDLNSVKTRFISMLERNPREILLKVKLP